MRSPFPGMDPYLEQFWQDVHASLIIYIRDQLEDYLPESLIARVEERVVLATDDFERRSIYPDVRIVERRRNGKAGVATMRRSAVIEPVIVEYRDEPQTETYIQIVEADPRQKLVTVIEVLSLSNKLGGEGQRQYRQKQEELRDAGVSLVEIDLLRRGERVLSLPVPRIPPHVRTTYQVCVRRGWNLERFEVYPAPLRGPLPNIKIPLRKKDADVTLELQAVVNQAYRKGRYHLTIDYRAPLEPPLSAADAKWAKTRAKAARAK